MKTTIAVLTFVLALTLCAGAQQQISFTNLPLAAQPAPVPSGYYGLNWNNIFYVDPLKWSGAGPGFLLSSVPNRDVAFVGSASCTCCPPVHQSCSGSISGSSTGSNSTTQVSFQALSAIVAAGFHPNDITVLAYSHGNFVGMATYSLNAQLQTLLFPPSWGEITQLTFQTDAGGDLVFYSLAVNFSGGSVPPQ
ncbi:MAG TPA: hypothetical protein VKB58_11290 [Terriglobales bacterium]|jgi:hypothetical protein|nr:hypothetical protein [Terriglobales bacterium]